MPEPRVGQVAPSHAMTRSGRFPKRPFESEKNYPNWGSFSNTLWPRHFQVKMLPVCFFGVRKALLKLTRILPRQGPKTIRRCSDQTTAAQFPLFPQGGTLLNW